MALCPPLAPIKAIPMSLKEFRSVVSAESKLADAIAAGNLSTIHAIVSESNLSHSTIYSPSVLTRLTTIPQSLKYVYENAMTYLTPSWLVETAITTNISTGVFTFLFSCYSTEHQLTISNLLSELSLDSRAYYHILSHASKLNITITPSNLVDVVTYAPRYFHQQRPLLPIREYKAAVVEAATAMKNMSLETEHIGAVIFISLHIPGTYTTGCNVLKLVEQQVATLDNTYALTIIAYAKWFDISTAGLVRDSLWQSRQHIGEIAQLEADLLSTNDLSLIKFCGL